MREAGVTLRLEPADFRLVRKHLPTILRRLQRQQTKYSTRMAQSPERRSTRNIDGHLNHPYWDKPIDFAAFLHDCLTAEASARPGWEILSRQYGRGRGKQAMRQIFWRAVRLAHEIEEESPRIAAPGGRFL